MQCLFDTFRIMNLKCLLQSTDSAYIGIEMIKAVVAICTSIAKMHGDKSSELLSLLLFCIQHRLFLPLLFRFEGNLISFLFYSSNLQNTRREKSRSVQLNF